MKKLTTPEFIEKSRTVHGDKFDYSEVECIGSVKKVKIICLDHGAFEQTPNSHLSGNGCPKCYFEQKTSITLEFIEKSRTVHRDKYDYSMVEYVNNATKVKISCSEHGVFEQTPANHLNGNGCPKCGGTSKSNTLEFIEKSRTIHGDKYDYSEVDYINNKTKVKILCFQHGAFEQTPNSHLSGKGCPNCKKSNIPAFIEKSRTIHGDKYDYSEVDYINNYTKVKISCSQHGIFEQSPNSHLKGHGCPTCAKEKSQYEKYKNKPTTLYYIKIGDFFKIGLTQTSIENRFKKEIGSGLNIEIIKTLEFKDGYDALLLEQRILQETLENQVTREQSPIDSGWTEVRNKCFLEKLS